jgi:hypothetical protein
MADDPAATAEPPQDPPQNPPADDDLAAVLKDAQNPDAVKNAIDRQKADAKAARDEAASLKARLQEIEDRDKTEQQKKDEAAAKAETRATTAEAKLMRFEVAAAKNIPLKHAHRLQGSNKQELEKDADELAKELNASDDPPDFAPGARTTAKNTDMDSLIRGARR